MYADETGNLDYEGGGGIPRNGVTSYFGFGTATFVGDHGSTLYQGVKVRSALEHSGLRLEKGFHATYDSHATRKDVYEAIQAAPPTRFDFTMLLKANAYPGVRQQGAMRLYKLAWYLHFKEVAVRACEPRDTLHAVVGTFGTKERKKLARLALEDVCSQVARDIHLCTWDAATSWGLQVADYGSWAVQRHLEGRDSRWYEDYVEPSTRSLFTPWGKLVAAPDA